METVVSRLQHDGSQEAAIEGGTGGNQAVKGENQADNREWTRKKSCPLDSLVESPAEGMVQLLLPCTGEEHL